jgi:hypothetical protein
MGRIFSLWLMGLALICFVKIRENRLGERTRTNLPGGNIRIFNKV